MTSEREEARRVLRVNRYRARTLERMIRGQERYWAGKAAMARRDIDVDPESNINCCKTILRKLELDKQRHPKQRRYDVAGAEQERLKYENALAHWVARALTQ